MVISLKNKSIWIKNSKEDKTYKNNFENDTDILIIGGGLTGLSCAHFLKDSKYKITLIDKSKLARGVTSKTTAKINYLQGIIYQTLANNFDFDTAKMYYESQKEAIELIKNNIEENAISCDFKKVDSIIFTTKNNGVKKIVDEKKLLECFGVQVYVVPNSNWKIGIKVTDTYIFNPLKYLNFLINEVKNKINICENCIATNIKKIGQGFEVETNKGKIKAKKVIVACHYPFFIFPLITPLKTYIKREYVTAAKVDNPKNFTAINIDKKLHSIRFYKQYVIYGSNEQKLTNKLNYKKWYEKSRKDFYEIFNKLPEYSWMNQDIVSHDSLPFIGEFEKDIYIATAYNAWGMTNATIAAKIITDEILNKENKYRKIFDPKRINAPLIFGSILGSFSYLKAYIEAFFVKNNPYYIKIKGVLYGIYIDEQNKKHCIKLICPHMKCSLVFNKEEQTWDCPCHGSRFNLDGKLLEGPATKNVNCDKKEESTYDL